MFIKLTNASSPFQGKPFIIIKDIIVSVFETEIEQPVTPSDDNVVELPHKEKVTAVFCGTVGTWHVKETVEEIYKLLEVV
jgi:hypothetical protein